MIASGLLSADPEEGTVGEGGVTFRGDRLALYRANLHLRTASRIIVRLGSFYATGFPELRKKAGRLAWEKYLHPGQQVALSVTCRKSRLYHSGAVAERVAAAIADHLGQPIRMTKISDEAENSDILQTVFVRLVNDLITISVDSSGALLHKRGYRLETAKAPLRETLAAAILLASEWDMASPLIDPFCGSGTIAIEAALMAMKCLPGCAAGQKPRRFAFMNWPQFDQFEWDKLVDSCARQKISSLPGIFASDRDAGAIRIAIENARRAGVANFIEFSQQAVSAIEPPPDPGWVVTNPPYGQRISANKDLRNLYAQIGNVLREKCPNWQAAILCSDMMLLGQTGLSLQTSLSTVNGGISVRLGRGKVR